MEARLRDIFLTASAGEPMQRREQVSAVAGGLEGDRYERGTGHFTLDACAVTLVEWETLEQIAEAYDLDLSSGQHRRNLVTRGVSLEDLLGATFRIGDAVFRGTRRRPPCAYLDSVAEPPGISDALKQRGGICADVLEPGEMCVGDSLELVESDPRTAGRAIAERLAAETAQEEQSASVVDHVPIEDSQRDG